MFLCMVDIKQREDGSFSVKLDGKEMSQFITGLTFTVDENKIPTLEVKVAVEGFNLASKCIFAIPKPYSSFIAEEAT